MSAPGSRKINPTGRSADKFKPPKGMKRLRVEEGNMFVSRPAAMMASPAFRVLSQTEHRILARLEVELGTHGGNDNGNLPCTYEDFVEYGARRASVAPALRALEALGFIEVTEQGRAGNAAFRRPNKFRLTYPMTRNKVPTHEWRKIETLEEAERIAAGARATAAQSVPKRNHKPGVAKNRTPVLETEPQVNSETELRVRFRNGTTTQGSETEPLSISGGEGGCVSRTKRAAQRARAADGGHSEDPIEYLNDVHAELKRIERKNADPRALRGEAQRLRQMAIDALLKAECRNAAASLLAKIEGAAA